MVTAIMKLKRRLLFGRKAMTNLDSELKIRDITLPTKVRLPCSSAGKQSAYNAEDTSLIPGSGSSPGEGISYPLQYSWVSLVAQMIKSDVGDLGSIPRLGRSPGGGHGTPLQYSCLENPRGQRSLVDHSPWGHKESAMTEHAYNTQVRHGLWDLSSPTRD